MPVIENWEVERLTLQAVNGNCTWKALWPQVFCNSSYTTSSPVTLSWVVCLFAYFVFRSKNIKWKWVAKRNWKEELHLKLAGSPEFPLLIYVGTDSHASLCAGKPWTADLISADSPNGCVKLSKLAHSLGSLLPSGGKKSFKCGLFPVPVFLWVSHSWDSQDRGWRRTSVASSIPLCTLQELHAP